MRRGPFFLILVVFLSGLTFNPASAQYESAQSQELKFGFTPVLSNRE